MDYDSFLNKVARNRHEAFLRQLFDSIGTDDSYIILAGGLPDETVFPFTDIQLTLRDDTSITIEKDDITKYLQYGVTAGNPELLEWITELTRQLHDPPTMKNPDHAGKLTTVLTNGASDAIYKTSMMSEFFSELLKGRRFFPFTKELDASQQVAETIFEEGDIVLVEEPVFFAFLSIVKPLGCTIVPVNTDERGIIPESLETILSQLPNTDLKTLPKIKALYLVPNGGNPTGSRYSLERKVAIYRLAQLYNFLIIEDDAYFFLEEKPLLPTFLSMDVDGRVLRIDSFTKTIAPGLRLGYISGPQPIVKKILYLSQCSSQGCSGISQAVLLHTLKSWGHDGYRKHCESVARHYAAKREQCIEYARKHLSGLATWHEPTGGMFLWVKFTGLDDSFPLITDRLAKRNVVLLPGKAFHVSTTQPSPCARISYTLVSAEKMDKGFKIVAEELRSMRGMDD